MVLVSLDEKERQVLLVDLRVLLPDLIGIDKPVLVQVKRIEILLVFIGGCSTLGLDKTTYLFGPLDFDFLA